MADVENESDESLSCGVCRKVGHSPPRFSVILVFAPGMTKPTRSFPAEDYRVCSACERRLHAGEPAPWKRTLTTRAAVLDARHRGLQRRARRGRQGQAAGTAGRGGLAPALTPGHPQASVPAPTASAPRSRNAPRSSPGPTNAPAHPPPMKSEPLDTAPRRHGDHPAGSADEDAFWRAAEPDRARQSGQSPSAWTRTARTSNPCAFFTRNPPTRCRAGRAPSCTRRITRLVRAAPPRARQRRFVPPLLVQRIDVRHRAVALSASSSCDRRQARAWESAAARLVQLLGARVLARGSERCEDRQSLVRHGKTMRPAILREVPTSSFCFSREILGQRAPGCLRQLGAIGVIG